jgi:hypothetical protein
MNTRNIVTGDLPDFIIIGAMKSATSTLHDQLSDQPGIFMSVPKEPNFFSDDTEFSKGHKYYADLFSRAPASSLRGESSTHYAKLPTYPHTVKRIGDALPGVKFIYVMRHPVDRLISHYVHEWTKGVYNCSLENAIEQYSQLVSYSQYSMQLEPYFEAFGRSRVCPVFFDRLVLSPQEEFERICRFIGYNHKPTWVTDLPPSNISTERVRRFPFYRLLFESAIATWLRRELIPQGIRDRLKSRLTMQDKPELSDSTRAKLEEIFDADLATLGGWVGVDLNCGNFKEITRHAAPEWEAVYE